MELDVPAVIKNSLDKPVIPKQLQSPFQYKEKNNRTLFKDYKLLEKVWALTIFLTHLYC